MKKVLITGGAGFIGSSLADSLLMEGGWDVTSLDNFDPFYPESIKRSYIESQIANPNFTFVEADICDLDLLCEKLGSFDVVVHLAAKAGVLPSIKNPIAYQQANVLGTQNMLEFAVKRGIKQFVFASSSSVYGVNQNYPWSESDYVLKPISPYAATKIAAELLGHTYVHLFGIRFLALRFFTVFGPRQRPDLAINKFSKAILSGNEITLYGKGDTIRDYTYVGDIVNGIRLAMDYSKSNYEVVNIGNNKGVKLLELVNALEKVLGKKAKIKFLPEQPGDVPITFADISKAQHLLGYNPQVSLESGLTFFKEWMLANPIQL